MNFTKEQQLVIDTRGKDLLVAAAAGSGKTAVLVERIIQMITDEQHPIDIDRLLVVTFTRAAAGEMRERIQAAILKRLEENPEDEHLQKQGTLIHNANITTIDRFCKNILQNNFNEIGLDPGFRVGDTGELQLLMADTVAAVLEEAYTKKRERFLNFMEAFSTKKNDQDVADAIIRLYQYSESKPFPLDWLFECAQIYDIKDEPDLLQKPFMQEIWDFVLREIAELEQEASDSLALCLEPGGPYMYETAIRADLEQLRFLLKSEDMNALYRGFATLSYETLGRKSDKSVSEEAKETVKERRNQMKDSLADLKKRYFFTSPAQMAQDLSCCKNHVEELTCLTIEFRKQYEAVKRDRNIVDFGDLEHLALQVLLTKEGDTYVPSKAAMEYRDYFEEILIDEYQDSNEVQESLLTAIARTKEGSNNLFMVGDVKQSIYKFRLAKPELFMEKYAAYSADVENEGEHQVKIDLHKNFRSRREVLDTVNFMFRQIMGREIGNIEYDDAASLYYGANYAKRDETVVNPYETEFCIIEEDEKKEITKKELEAKAVSKRIRELHESFQVEDKKTGEFRPVQYSDMVILLRTNAGWDTVFQEVLENDGIPVHIASRTGYFSALEIKSILNYIKLLDNPLDDINLAAVLKSLFGGFSDEELSKIRLTRMEGSFVQAFFGAAEKKPEDMEEPLYNKIQEFLEIYHKLRNLIPYTPIHELLQIIIREYHYDYLIGAMSGCKKRRANLDMLLEKSQDFENTSYKGLFHFVQYMEQLQKYDVDYGEANLVGENEDTVRIMSIHKSKGLEFPICFLCGMSKKFNTQDLKQRLILDADHGIGIDFVDPLLRVKAGTIVKNYMIERQMTDNLGEELRVLYVAMTRAEEKLILTGTVPDIEKLNTDLINVSTREVRRAGSFFDLARIAFMGKTLNPQLPLKIDYLTVSDLVEAELVKQTEEIQEREHLLDLDLQKEYDSSLREHLSNAFHYVYPYPGRGQVYTKVSVSELKRQQSEHEEFSFDMYEEEEMDPLLPKFMQKDIETQTKGSTRGTAYHKVMELLPLGKTEDIEEIKSRINNMISEHRIDAASAALVNPTAIKAFLDTSLAERMEKAGNAGRLFREQPFVLGRPASELNAEYPKDEMILIQGIIDVYFEEEDGLVVADYKTDRVNTVEELVDKYKVQLEYYAEALEQMTGKKVKEKIIYSFSLSREISF